MAVPAIVIKLAATAATDKRTWKILAVLIAAALMPMILALAVLASVFAGISGENKSLLDYSFKYYSIPYNFTYDQKQAVMNMRGQLEKLNDTMEKSKFSLDENLVRAVFYCLNFGGELGEDFDFGQFCECFDRLTFEQLDTALQNVSERFPQYEITGNTAYSVPKVYEYLNGEAV